MNLMMAAEGQAPEGQVEREAEGQTQVLVEGQAQVGEAQVVAEEEEAAEMHK
jgi:hypothetical protein